MTLSLFIKPRTRIGIRYTCTVLRHITSIARRQNACGLTTHKLLSVNPEHYDDAALQGIRDLLGLAADARALFSDLMREGSHVGDRAGMRQGELAAGEGDRRGAILEYRKTLDDFPDTRFAAQLWLRIGEANVTIGSPARLDSAMAAFDRALSASPSDSVRYRASLSRGRVRHLQGHPDAALETYQALLNKGNFRAWEGETRILIGRHYQERAQLTESLAQYERVRDDFPQTDVSAMALYETGLLYLQEHGQRERAQDTGGHGGSVIRVNDDGITLVTPDMLGQELHRTS